MKHIVFSHRTDFFSNQWVTSVTNGHFYIEANAILLKISLSYKFFPSKYSVN